MLLSRMPSASKQIAAIFFIYRIWYEKAKDVRKCMGLGLRMGVGEQMILVDAYAVT